MQSIFFTGKQQGMMVQQLTSISNWVYHQHHRRHHPLPHGTPVTSNCLQTYEIVSYHWKQKLIFWLQHTTNIHHQLLNFITTTSCTVSRFTTTLLSVSNSAYGDDFMDPLLSSFWRKWKTSHRWGLPLHHTLTYYQLAINLPYVVHNTWEHEGLPSLLSYAECRVRFS